jgi:hypothetical protein
MTRQQWVSVYQEAWSLYYTPEHMRTLLRRAVATGVPIGSLVKLLVTFATAVHLEKMHPLQTGILRLKRPSERRPGMPRENPWSFWTRFVWESLGKHAALASTIVRLVVAARAISRNPATKDYMDQALKPVGDDGDETLDLLTKTTGGNAAVTHIKKVARLTSGIKAA